MIEFGREYSTKEFKELLGFSARQWKDDKDKILEYLKDYFDYEWYEDPKDRRRTVYVVKAQHKEYVPYSRVRLKQESKREFFEELVTPFEGCSAVYITKMIEDKVLEKYDMAFGTIMAEVRKILYRNGDNYND